MGTDLTIRISDEDRAAAARALDVAVADGRLSWTEHAERSETVWAARTRGDLVPVLADLGPELAAGPIGRPTGTPQRIEVTLSKVIRTPDTTRPIEAFAKFGAVFLDLTALRPGERVELSASSFCGKVVLHVGHDTQVIDDGDVWLGKRKVLGTPPGPGGPVVHVTGRSSLGHFKVFRGSWR
ncbi:DUF1707 SHOCT-like domain-containing protein [Labedaea rhizosphaerae]|uniref:Uncharacterized protein DUF1707 n=1 Tax=Labedaea rhizosphaerae TaxID=598644 RepID=A0A4R6RY14_LABRH|nr:DUF1707 domain-containing protein [Labedaea rhizosphaerae]TDP91970.1 uncharacterized protein DUF1707 [Labedaea rhizosphaerae]